MEHGDLRIQDSERTGELQRTIIAAVLSHHDLGGVGLRMDEGKGFLQRFKQALFLVVGGKNNRKER